MMSSRIPSKLLCAKLELRENGIVHTFGSAAFVTSDLHTMQLYDNLEMLLTQSILHQTEMSVKFQLLGTSSFGLSALDQGQTGLHFVVL